MTLLNQSNMDTQESITMDHSSFSCRLCDGEAIPYPWIGIKPEWYGGECSSCGSISIRCVPSESELTAYYNDFNLHYDGGHEGGGNLIRYARAYLSQVRRYVKKGSLIDVGSSTSPFPNVAAQAGFDVSVMDYVRPKNLDCGITYIQGNLNSQPQEAILEGYDVVTAWAVLEHTQNPVLAVQLLSEMCKVGGNILISIPEFGTAITRNSIGQTGWYSPPMHLHLPSPKAMRSVFLRFNLVMIDEGRLELNPFRYIARYSLGLVGALFGGIVRVLVSNKKWRSLRDKKIQKYSGIKYYVFVKIK